MVIKRRQGAVYCWCLTCEVEVIMLTPDEAASLTSASTRELYRMVDAGEVHFIETPAGLIRVCLPSLLKTVDRPNCNQQLYLRAKVDDEKS